MKVAIFTDTYLPNQNGVAHSVKRQTEVLRAEGHEVLIIATGETLADINLKSIKILRTRDNRYDFRVPISNFSIISRKFIPDIIHVHTPFAVGLYGILFAKFHHLPIAYTHHTNFNYYLHYIRGFNNRIGQLLLSWSYRKFLSKIPLIITPSLHSARVLIEDFTQPAYKVVTIPTPVLIDKHPELKEKMYDLVFVGRISEEKNITLAIKVIRKLFLKLPHIKVAFIGDGIMMSDLKSELSDFSNNVTVFGELTNSEVLNKIEQSKFLFFPSYSETQGLVIQEGWSKGVPVIGVSCDLMSEYVKEGKNGWISSRNVENLTSKTYQLLRKGTTQYIQNYCLKSAENFSASIWYEKYSQSITKFLLKT